jgi:hypothetical protein
MLKTELRNMERAQKREGVDMTYLKNVVLKLLETGNIYKRVAVTIAKLIVEVYSLFLMKYLDINDIRKLWFL